jgi:hypothetical protein
MKLFSGWVWLVLSVAISLVILSYALFMWWIPKNAYAAQLDDYTQKLTTEANKLPRAQAKLKKAQEDVQKKAQEWQAVVAQKTPPESLAGGGIDLSVNPYQLTVDARKFRDSVQRAVNAQVKKGGITVVSAPEIPTPTDDPGTILADFFNYPAARFPVCVFELGQITVRGSYSQISNHISGWSAMPDYLAVASGLTLSGTSPELTASYNLVVVAFLKGEQMSIPVPSGAAPGAATAMAGAPAAGGMPPRGAAPQGPPPGVPGGSGGPQGGQRAPQGGAGR